MSLSQLPSPPSPPSKRMGSTEPNFRQSEDTVLRGFDKISNQDLFDEKEELERERKLFGKNSLPLSLHVSNLSYCLNSSDLQSDTLLLQMANKISDSLKPKSESIVNKDQKIEILKNINFSVRPGQFLAILGSSGSGKTTLLDLVSNRVKKNNSFGLQLKKEEDNDQGISGSVSLIDHKNQKVYRIINSPTKNTQIPEKDPEEKKTFLSRREEKSKIKKEQKESKNFLRERCGYVVQNDHLLPNLTVRETLHFVARLRLKENQTMTVNSKKHREGHSKRNFDGNQYASLGEESESGDEEKKKEDAISEKVQQVIDELGLRHVADNRIGGSLMGGTDSEETEKGLSGGEKRRVSIGIQLLTDPSILLLDEPTSGLDSFTSHHIISTLVSLSLSSRTVLCTIHQPRSDIFSLFDLIMFLSHGRIVYFGPANQLVEYFSTPIDFPFNRSSHPGSSSSSTSSTPSRLSRTSQDLISDIDLHQEKGIEDENEEKEEEEEEEEENGKVDPLDSGNESERLFICPKLTNPCDYYLDLCTVDYRTSESEHRTKNIIQNLVDRFEYFVKVMNQMKLERARVNVNNELSKDKQEQNKEIEREREGEGEGKGEGEQQTFGESKLCTQFSSFYENLQTIPELLNSKISVAPHSSPNESMPEVSSPKNLFLSSDSIEQPELIISPTSELSDLTSNYSDNQFQSVSWYRPSLFTQFRILYIRACMNLYKDYKLVLVLMFQSLFMGILVGGIYWDLKLDQTGVNDRFGMFYIVTSMFPFMVILSTVDKFCKERESFYFEVLDGIYSLLPYYLAKVFSEIPLNFICSLMYALPLFYLPGLQGSCCIPYIESSSDSDQCVKFYYFLISIQLMIECSRSFALTCAAAITNFQKATFVANLTFTLFLLPSGFLINLDSLWFGVSWLSHVSYIRYGFQALSRNEFEGLEFTCNSPDECIFHNGDEALEAYSVDQSLSNSITLMIVFILICRTFTYVFLKMVSQKPS